MSTLTADVINLTSDSPHSNLNDVQRNMPRGRVLFIRTQYESFDPDIDRTFCDFVLHRDDPHYLLRSDDLLDGADDAIDRRDKAEAVSKEIHGRRRGRWRWLFGPRQRTRAREGGLFSHRGAWVAGREIRCISREREQDRG